MRRHAAVTIVAHNYVAQARVLAASFMAHHPDGEFFTLVIDGRSEDRRLHGLGAVLLVEDLPLTPEVRSEMAMMYDVMEFATALKPAALLHLHHLGALTATYLDPDIRVYADLRDVFESAASAGMALTPHMLRPYPDDDLRLQPSDVMHSGMYNLGFLSTGPAAIRFLAWWCERLKTDAVVDLQQALFTDQRWMDWSTSFERPAILHDPGLNVAYWNLHERGVVEVEGGFEVNGGPLRFFHFSGYDPLAPWLLSKHMLDRPRPLLSEMPGLRTLADAYGAELVEQRHTELRTKRYRLDRLPDGSLLNPYERRLYRDAVLGRDARIGAPPDLVAEPYGLRPWLDEPLPAREGLPPITRTEFALWRTRPDLVAAFPEPFGAHAESFASWLLHDPHSPSHARPRPLGMPRHSDAGLSRAGWSVAAYARAELGVGGAGRRVAKLVAHSGIPSELVGYTGTSLSRQAHAPWRAVADRARYNHTILCVNADQTPSAIHDLGLPKANGALVGYWFWELESFPAHYRRAVDMVDEIWVSSEFNRRSISELSDTPVRLVPLPMRAPSAPTALRRQDLGLPEDRFVFLVNFDYLSVMKRKNPLGALRAYLAAFGPDDGACLVIKSINGEYRRGERERVRLAATGRPDVVLLEDYVTASEMAAMIEVSDAYVSLHRSEGYGLNIADAFALGTPVIATAYSGNMDFCDSGNTLLVPASKVPVGPGAEPYDATSLWAEPDLDVASSHMRRLFDDRSIGEDLVARGRERAAHFSAERLGNELRPVLLDLMMGTMR